MNKLVACVLSSAWALLASGADLSNEVGVKHWLRDALTYDDQSDTFSTNALSGVAESAALETSAASLPVLMDEATEALRADLEPMQARLAIEAQRPVVMITGAAGLDNALDRENLTMAVVSNEWTVAADGSRHLDCYVFSNKILASPPIVDAALMTDLGTVTNWVRGVWNGYGTRACTVELEHQNAYTNFVIVSRTYGATSVTNVDVSIKVTDHVPEVTDKMVTYDMSDYVQDGLICYWDPMTGGIRYTKYELKGAGRVPYNPHTVEIRAMVHTWDKDKFGSRPDYQFLWNNCNYPCLLRQSSCFPIEAAGYGSTGIFYPRGQTSLYLNGNIAGLWPFENMIYRAYSAPGGESLDLTYYTNRVEFACTQCTNRYGTSSYVTREPYSYALTTSSSATNSLQDVKFYRLYNRELSRAEIMHNQDIDELRLAGATKVIQVTNFVEHTSQYTQTLTLTNAVLITIDGQQPQVTLRGDKEYFECYRLCFDLPPAESVRLNPWVKIGHPETGFDFGNRQLRINGAMTVTTNDVSEIGEWFTPDGNRVELTPYLDQGLLRFSDLKEDEE